MFDSSNALPVFVKAKTSVSPYFIFDVGLDAGNPTPPLTPRSISDTVTLLKHPENAYDARGPRGNASHIFAMR